DGGVLLFNDSDYTPEDQNNIYKETKDNIDKLTALHSLGRGSDAAAAIESSTKPVFDLKNDKGSVVTPVNTTSITVAPIGSVTARGNPERKVISPEALKAALRTIR